MPPAALDDLVAVITSDHHELELIMAELQLGEGTPEYRRDLADHLTTVLVRHMAGEEMYVYPAARKALPDGDRIIDREIGEHAEIERILKELEGIDASDPAFGDLTTSVITETRHHLHAEEQRLLPRLREVCSTEELQELGRTVLKAKESAPTRPHPSAPHKPPANLILAPGIGMIDRLRDTLTGRSHD